MSDYLSNLAARSLNLAQVIQPRLASLFEPNKVEANGDLPVQEWQEDIENVSALDRLRVRASSFPTPQSTVPNSQLISPPAQNSPEQSRNQFIPEVNQSIPTSAVTTEGTSVTSPENTGVQQTSTPFPPVIQRVANQPTILSSQFSPPPNTDWLMSTEQGQEARIRITPGSHTDGHSPIFRRVMEINEGSQDVSNVPVSPHRPVPVFPHQPVPTSSPPISPTPLIQVTIGRIDVRAITPPAPAKILEHRQHPNYH
ncbi:hypothetical protein [Scytonema sp. PRP1]|uniref:hypothetical protein n=1 Tax=Scytonema sp. PRP1 TaxID=3120513 RepID=UPI00300C5641